MALASWFLFAQQQQQVQIEGGVTVSPIVIVIYLAIVVLSLAGLWKVFAKAGEPGWAAIVPIYNIIVLTKIAGRPLWWVLLLFIPCVGLVIAIVLYIDLAKNFGKGAGYGIGLAFLPFIFFPLLGFSDAQYRPIKRA